MLALLRLFENVASFLCSLMIVCRTVYCGTSDCSFFTDLYQVLLLYLNYGTVVLYYDTVLLHYYCCCT